MKFRWTFVLLIVVVLAASATAQTNPSQPPANHGLEMPEPSSRGTPSPESPQDTLNQYEKQMALVTVETYEELAQIAQAVRMGQIGSDEAEHVTRRCFELGMIRLQFLETLHQIVETSLSKGSSPALLEEHRPEVQASGDTVVVAPSSHASDIPESVAQYLKLTPTQIAVIQARLTAEQREIQPLLQQLSQNRRALTMATHTKRYSNSRIRTLAVKQSHILMQLILVKSRLERDVYRILTIEQRQKLDDVETETQEVTQLPFAQR